MFRVLCLLTFAAWALSAQSSFRAAVAKTDITPDQPQWLLGYAARMSKGVYDRIYHRMVLLDDGRTRFALVSSDIALVSPAEYDRVAALVERKLGIPPLQFWWSVTHTHSAPEVGPPGLPVVFLGDRYKHEFNAAYADLVAQRLVEGLAEAQTNLRPARLGVGWGSAMANINRRARDVEGDTFLGLNPDGPADRRIGLLRLDKEDGSPLALLANYAIHGTVLGGQNLLISGDAPGVVAEYVERKAGAPLLFINGAAGNLAPIYTVMPDPKAGHLSQFRTLLGDKILAANATLTSTTPQVSLKAGAVTVETPRKAGLAWTDELASYARNTSTGAAVVRLPVRFLQINHDIAIWSAPLELFCEIAMDVRNRSPFPYTFYFGYTNGWLGYLLTAEEWQYGGYEPRVSPYTPQAAKDLTDAVVAYWQGAHR